MSKRKIIDNTVSRSGVNTRASLAAAASGGGGDGGGGGGGVSAGAPLSGAPAPAVAVTPVAPAAAGGVVAAAVTYAAGVRTRILQQTNLIPDLVGIILSYTAFCGDEKVTVNGHTEGVCCVAVFPNGNFCSGSSGKTIKIWNQDGACLRTLQGA